jgi:manganese-dependent ADP-ribose/CDP-alcohol diphosphatase
MVIEHISLLAAVSVNQAEGSVGYEKAAEILKKENPNDVLGGMTSDVNFFAGLSGAQLRFVPFNGGFGAEQLAWLSETLHTCTAASERMVIMTHLPIHPDAANVRAIAYDYDVLLEQLHTEGKGTVVAVFAGHYHTGGFTTDAAGLHHVTVEAPLTHGRSFGEVQVHADRLELLGEGALPSRSLPFAV